LGVANGTLVEVKGNLSVYDVRGEYQFNVKQLRLAGIGTLQQRFEMLKNKLDAEGLFDPERKKPIPVLPRKIGVVSSPSGAAIRDFLQILDRRFSKVEVRIFPAQVQGAGAAAELAAGVEFFNRTGLADVIVVTRGGGSMEDLWCFNEEILARAVAESRIPVISAVGHEIDFTICDFVSDLRVPTPSAAAELVIGRHDEIFSRLDRCMKDIRHYLQSATAAARVRFERAAASAVFHEPRQMLELRSRHIDELELRAGNALKLRLSENMRRLDNLKTALSTLNPEKQLERGYAMVLDADGKKVITSSRIPPETELQVRFADGTVGVKTL
jgi:exodeoxyribonuclease VII large subunit